ncbi:MAG: MiaB/RimO family radical SAM methylthiotransferase, partial [Bacteroidia bacterium]|nr:MiaB/RimO family radical SAM methylthiotransferase [Bacteroidia bacterium]
VMACEIDSVSDFVATSTEEDKTRVYLKVQDGCNYNCSFCTIPLARGKSRSDSLDNIIQRANDIATKGANEIILTGINLGDYGLDGRTGERFATFYDLLQRLDNEVDIPRIRISSIEPNLLSDEIIELVASSNKIVPHFHIPLQSGSDEVLRAMQRRYKREVYSSRVNKIKALMPNCCIGVDVITGFPGETDADFNLTYEFLKNLPISYLHVFTYSERENTKAVNLPGVVELSKRKERNKILRELSEEKQKHFYQTQQGKQHRVLFEKNNRNDFVYGYTDNYIRVKHKYDESLCNSLVDCTVDSLDNLMASASLLKPALAEQF